MKTNLTIAGTVCRSLNGNETGINTANLFDGMDRFCFVPIVSHKLYKHPFLATTDTTMVPTRNAVAATHLCLALFETGTQQV